MVATGDGAIPRYFRRRDASHRNHYLVPCSSCIQSLQCALLIRCDVSRCAFIWSQGVAHRVSPIAAAYCCLERISLEVSAENNKTCGNIIKAVRDYNLCFTYNYQWHLDGIIVHTTCRQYSGYAKAEETPSYSSVLCNRCPPYE